MTNLELRAGIARQLLALANKILTKEEIADSEFRGLLHDLNTLEGCDDEELPQVAQICFEMATDDGFAVAVFTPEELEEVDAEKVSEAMVEKGWEVIDRHTR